MLWKFLEDTKTGDKPSHLAVVFDAGRLSFRNTIYTEYKAQRPDPPDDLVPQFPLTREATRAFGVCAVEKEGYEADDLIATYARLACDAGASATIVSSDKDLMQLVTDCVVMYDTMKDKRIGIPEVIEKFGVGPDKVIEVQALIGDSTDNVPGVPGIGPKTAAELIGVYGNLETVLARAGEIKQDKRRQALIDNADAARMSKKLVTLDQNVPLEVPIADLTVRDPDYPNLIPFLQKMGFKTLAQRVADKAGPKGEAKAVEASAAAPKAAKAAEKPLPVAGTGDLFASSKTFAKSEGDNVLLTPMALAARRAEELRNAIVDSSKYEIVRTLDRLHAWIARAHDSGLWPRIASASSSIPLPPLPPSSE
jgi:DNA polymerase-1